MAVKQVAILIRIDSGEQEQSCYSGRSDLFPGNKKHEVPGADETYIVGIHNSNSNREHHFMEAPNKNEMLDCAAHELGHVLSAIFDLPGGMLNDPRQKGELQGLFAHPNSEQVKRILENETLAWKLAEKIRPELDKESARKDLDSYSPEGFEKARKGRALVILDILKGLPDLPESLSDGPEVDPTLWHNKPSN
jgi:hypothetical protein